MTELTAYNPPAEVATIDPTGGRLVAWAEGLAAAHRIGAALCQTSFAPKHFMGKPAEAAAAIMFGDEIGLTPTQALRSVYVISGTPALYARTMVALVQSRGHEVWTETDTPTKVVVCGRRRGSEVTERAEWTVDRARKAGYTNNKKYETDPQAMLYARAASDVCRKVAADALAGLAHTVEELELEQPQPAVRISRAKAERPVTPEPEFEAVRATEPVADVTPEPEFDEPAPKPMSAKTRGHMFALFSDLGISEDDQRAGIAHIVGHPIESRGELTEDEARLVVDRLKAKKAEASA